MKHSALLFLIFFSLPSYSQDFYFHDSSSTARLILNGDTLKTGFFGGFNSPRMSNTDLNADGNLDLFVFDPTDRKVLTFLGNGSKSNPQYLYAPQFEVFFPKMSQWALLVDMNCDGLEDILCGNGDRGVAIYFRNSKDISKGFSKKIAELNYFDLKYKYDLKFAVEPDDVPIVTDIDNDGDIDLLAFHQNGSLILYCQNQRVEQDLDCNELEFEIETNCWGMFQEGNNDASLKFLDDCYLDTWAASAHTGSNALALDLDNDGDKDILLSDLESKTVLRLENGRKQKGNLGASIDSIIGWTDSFPKYNMPIYMDQFPAMYSVDLDFDGVNDLYVAPGTELSNFTKNSWFYHNAGTNSKPNFKLKTKSFLKCLDFGGKSYPVFFDEDGDGDQDLLLATEEENGTYYVLHLIRNVGTAKRAMFELVDDNYLDLKQYKLEDHCALSFGDIDNNGTQDLIVGAVNGKLLHFSNQNKANQKVNFSLDANYFNAISTCDKPSPFIYDMDQDGQNDLLIGTDTGTVEYWQNKASKFTLKNKALGNIWVGETWGGTSFDGNANIHIGQIDSNSKPDMLIASDKGDLQIYFDIDLTKQNWTARTGNFFNRQVWADTSNKFLGEGLRIAATDLNADGLVDMLVAGKRGGIQIYHGIQAIKIDVAKPIWQKDISIWPNPNNGAFTIKVNDDFDKELNFTIYNSTGQVVVSQTALKTPMSQHDVAWLSSGIYLICIKDADNYYSQRLIIK